MLSSNNPNIMLAKKYCKNVLKLFRATGYICPELDKYYHFDVPSDISLMQVQHAYSVYLGYLNWSEMCKAFSKPFYFRYLTERHFDSSFKDLIYKEFDKCENK